MENLLFQRLLSQKNKSNYYLNIITSKKLLEDFSLCYIIGGHIGCVNTILFNQDGSLAITGSDDMTIQLHNIYTKKLELKIQTLHRGNIFDVKEIPETLCKQFISCAGK